MRTRTLDTQGIEKAAAEVAGVLRAVANERRLMILCKLVEWGEGNVNALAETVGCPNPRSPSISRRCETKDW